MLNKQTTLDLNGPFLSFVQQPQSVSVCDNGSATFVGIATAFFPVQTPPNPASNTGTLSYKWYAEGFGALTDGTFLGATIAGSATTTLTITNAKSPDTNGLKFYVGVDYVPSAYSQPAGSTVTVGTGRSTGNALNEILNSNSATLTVFPVLSVAQQPTQQTAAQTKTATFTTLGALTDASQGNISYRWQLNGTDLSDSATVTGSGTTTLSIALPNAGINTVRARLTHPTSCNSPVFTDTVNFSVVDARQIIVFEKYSTGSTATIETVNLFAGEYTLLPSSSFSLICFYAPEKNIGIEMDIYSSSGKNYGNFLGGEGGFSRVRFMMPKNVEYVIAGFNFGESAFVYVQSRLLLTIGAGGSAGLNGNGGAGGGIGVAGANGFGRGGGAGATIVANGQLGQNGLLGSSATTTPKASFPNGGRAVSCPLGQYWAQRGFSACTNMGDVQFYLANGTLVTNSAKISRGFKAGGGFRQTAGGGDYGALGGTGATGGNGGVGGGGGGGGSGYQDGSIQVIQSTLGGNIGTAKIIMRPYDLPQGFYIDSVGRILILSAVTPGKDPRTLTKITDQVLPGTDTCIDDVRWQNFIELARTQDYRLTVTLNGGTTAVSKATSNNIRRMINANYIPLKTSLTDWQLVPYSYPFYCLAWDENDISSLGMGSDYSILSWGGTSYYYGYYGLSSNSFFTSTSYGNQTANWWILPPGVPDFP